MGIAQIVRGKTPSQIDAPPPESAQRLDQTTRVERCGRPHVDDARPGSLNGKVLEGCGQRRLRPLPFSRRARRRLDAERGEIMSQRTLARSRRKWNARRERG